MFTLHLNRIVLTYAGCPANGVGAIDWRRAHGLPDAPTNRAGVYDPFRFQDEALCRLVPAKLDKNADLVIDDTTVALAASQCAILLAHQAAYNTTPESDRPSYVLSESQRMVLASLILAVFPSCP